MLIAYDAAGRVIATLDYVTVRDEGGEVVGILDFAAHESSGRKLREIWDVDGAAGSGYWPEWLGSAAHEFTVHLDGRQISALTHPSERTRTRADIERRITERKAEAHGRAADIRDIVGGPNRPLDIRGRQGHGG